MSEGSFDVWLLELGGHGASAALQRTFGVDAARAERILATLPRVVRHGSTALEADEVAAALRVIGAKVDVRPATHDPKASGVDFARPQRKRTAVSDVAAELGSGEVPISDPRLDLDAPLDMGAAPARATAPRPAPAPAPKPAPAPRPASPGDSLDPLDPLTEGAGALELDVQPTKEEKPKPVSRTGVDAESIRRIEEQRQAEDDPAAAAKASRKIPPWVLRTAIGLVVGGLFTFGLRTAGRSCVHRDAPAPLDVPSAEEHALAGAVDVQAFLARPGARLGIEQSRNRQLATQLRASGAPHVLAADVVDVSGADVATTLVVELPRTPATRRRVITLIESYEARGPVDPASVELPPPEEVYEFVSLE